MHKMLMYTNDDDDDDDGEVSGSVIMLEQLMSLNVD